MRVRCPGCGHFFEDDDLASGQCPNCAAAFSDASSSSPSSRANAGRPTPWERRAELGFFKGLFQTAVLAVKTPTRFFDDMPRDNAGGALLYFWLMGGLGLAFNGGTSVSLGGNFAIERYPLILAAFAAFIAAPISCLVGAALVHAMSRLFGARQPFHATLRAIGYSATPLVFGVLPLCGGVVGSILCLVHATIGVSRLQRHSTARSIAVLLLTPVVFSCFAGLAFFSGVHMFAPKA